jgi:hypothetical protein
VIRRWSRHSRRRVPIQRSSIALTLGARTGVLMLRMSALMNTASRAAANLLSRSRIRNRDLTHRRDHRTPHRCVGDQQARDLLMDPASRPRSGRGRRHWRAERRAPPAAARNRLTGKGALGVGKTAQMSAVAGGQQPSPPTGRGRSGRGRTLNRREGRTGERY